MITIMASPLTRSTRFRAPAKPGSACRAGSISSVTIRSISPRRPGVVPPSMSCAYMRRSVPAAKRSAIGETTYPVRACPDVRRDHRSHTRCMLRTAFLLGLLSALHAPWLRRPVLTWGATPAEAAMRLPGDELLEDADGVATRAIWIDAPAAAVWPWLAQMGPTPRGGAYTYDWIEDVLGLGMHSVDHVLPAYQHPQVGDTIALGSNRMRIEQVELQHVLAWRSDDGNGVWPFVIEERDGRPRLISRNRFRFPKLIARI